MKLTVKWFDNKRGFGFVVLPDGRNAFVHYSVIGGSGYKSLHEGDEVECEIEDSPKGPRAVYVTRTTME